MFTGGLKAPPGPGVIFPLCRGAGERDNDLPLYPGTNARGIVGLKVDSPREIFVLNTPRVTFPLVGDDRDRSNSNTLRDRRHRMPRLVIGGGALRHWICAKA
jgi:hypothetical protein